MTDVKTPEDMVKEVIDRYLKDDPVMGLLLKILKEIEEQLHENDKVYKENLDATRASPWPRDDAQTRVYDKQWDNMHLADIRQKMLIEVHTAVLKQAKELMFQMVKDAIDANHSPFIGEIIDVSYRCD